MKTQEQQKAELLDWLIDQCNKRPNAFNEARYFLVEVSKKYLEITQQKPLSQDPYCDEVFDGRLMAIINKYWSVDRKNQLSEMPNISFFKQIKGFGIKSVEEYIEVMTTYEMFDKL